MALSTVGTTSEMRSVKNLGWSGQKKAAAKARKAAPAGGSAVWHAARLYAPAPIEWPKGKTNVEDRLNAEGSWGGLWGVNFTRLQLLPTMPF